MALTDLITLDAIVTGIRGESKKQLFELLAMRCGQLLGRAQADVFETLFQRERLGSTGVGHGVAIPHGKLSNLEKVFGLFARLDKPIDFEALDGEPVDLVFVLLAPDHAGADHLKALARVARLLRDEETTAKLRTLRDTGAIHALLTQSQ
jgi:nitrogen PTS system EIIA component